jgi:hypothetical protein
MAIIDKYKFEHGGGVGRSNSDYHLRRTNCCESWCVEDDELSDLYLDPTDLTKKISLLTTPGVPIACPFCGSFKWGLSEKVLDVAQIPESWKWACYKR